MKSPTRKKIGQKSLDWTDDKMTIFILPLSEHATTPLQTAVKNDSLKLKYQGKLNSSILNTHFLYRVQLMGFNLKVKN